MRIAILGLGMMGASLGLALRQRGVGRVHGYARRSETRSAAIAAGVADEVHESPESACAGAERVIICTPIMSMADVLAPCVSVLAKGAIVTDVGSTKQVLVDQLGAMLADSPGCFIGSHPLAGSEQSGLEAARSNLYDGARVLVTPDTTSDADAVASIQSLWEALGSVVTVMDPATHDRTLALTSHVPHLVASAVSLGVLQDSDERVTAFCGQGFRDATRIAMGPEDVWHDIVRTNPHVLDELDRVVAELNTLRNDIASENFSGLRDTLRDARFLREQLGGDRAE